jgi:2-hydroxycyclohexanecarboxyl-CoA dehydrogenase
MDRFDDILDLKGRVLLVTGAGQGVGRQVALHFASHNAGGVIVNDYFLDRAEAVAEELRALGAKALAVQADVSDFDSVQRAATASLERFGRIDVLVNNAGNAGADPSRVARVPFWESSPEHWQPWLGVNLYGVIHSTRSVLPGMIENRAGSIITIISDAGRWGDAGMELYAAAKAGAAGFMRSVARGVGRYGIRANSVAIAATRTPAIAAGLADEERVRKMLRNYPIGRLGEPEDVANMVLFLASDASSWVTGQTYPVNGGFTFSL